MRTVVLQLFTMELVFMIIRNNNDNNDNNDNNNNSNNDNNDNDFITVSITYSSGESPMLIGDT